MSVTLFVKVLWLLKIRYTLAVHRIATFVPSNLTVIQCIVSCLWVFLTVLLSSVFWCFFLVIQQYCRVFFSCYWVIQQYCRVFFSCYWVILQYCRVFCCCYWLIQQYCGVFCCCFRVLYYCFQKIQQYCGVFCCCFRVLCYCFQKIQQYILRRVCNQSPGYLATAEAVTLACMAPAPAEVLA